MYDAEVCSNMRCSFAVCDFNSASVRVCVRVCGYGWCLRYCVRCDDVHADEQPLAVRVLARAQRDGNVLSSM